MDSIDSLKIYAGNNDVPIMFDETSDFICRYIKEHNVKSVLEIGTAIGFSAITFANCSPDIVVTTVEIDLDRFIQARQNVHDFNLLFYQIPCQLQFEHILQRLNVQF